MIAEKKPHVLEEEGFDPDLDYGCLVCALDAHKMLSAVHENSRTSGEGMNFYVEKAIMDLEGDLKAIWKKLANTFDS